MAFSYTLRANGFWPTMEGLDFGLTNSMSNPAVFAWSFMWFTQVLPHHRFNSHWGLPEGRVAVRLPHRGVAGFTCWKCWWNIQKGWYPWYPTWPSDMMYDDVCLVLEVAPKTRLRLRWVVSESLGVSPRIGWREQQQIPIICKINGNFRIPFVQYLHFRILKFPLIRLVARIKESFPKPIHWSTPIFWDLPGETGCVQLRRGPGRMLAAPSCPNLDHHAAYE